LICSNLLTSSRQRSWTFFPSSWNIRMDREGCICATHGLGNEGKKSRIEARKSPSLPSRWYPLKSLLPVFFAGISLIYSENGVNLQHSSCLPNCRVSDVNIVSSLDQICHFHLRPTWADPAASSPIWTSCTRGFSKLDNMLVYTEVQPHRASTRMMPMVFWSQAGQTRNMDLRQNRIDNRAAYD